MDTIAINEVLGKLPQVEPATDGLPLILPSAILNP